MHDTKHVELEQAPELLRVGLAERRGLGRAGIGDQDVERAAGGFGRLHAGFDRRRIGDIGDNHTGRMTGRDRIVERGLLAAKDGHGCAGRRQCCRHGAADAAAAASHESMPSRKQGHEERYPQVGTGRYFKLKIYRAQAMDLRLRARFRGRTGGVTNRSGTRTLIASPVPALSDRPPRTGTPGAVRESA